MSTDAAPGQALNPANPEVQKCPYAYYAGLHADEAAARDEGPFGWMVAGHSEIVEIVKQPKRFSSSFYGPDGPQLTGVSPEPYTPDVQKLRDDLYPLANALFSCDPPLHTKQKAVAIKCLNAHRIAALEPVMYREANDLIDQFIDKGRCEFLTEFATGLPLRMIAITLGIDRGLLPTFKRWSDDIADGYLAVIDNPRRAEVLRSVKEYQEYMLQKIAERRENPTDDLLSAMVNEYIEEDDAILQQLEGDTEIEGERRLSTEEVLAAVSQLLAAGNHTTTNLLANTAATLVQHPDVLEEVRNDRSLIPQMLDESLRRDAPLRCTYRVVTEDTDLRGTQVPAGSLMPMLWNGAGHDPAVFADPQKFDIHRPNLKKHLSFGRGPHFCVGNQLAKTQSRVAFDVLLDRLADWRFPAGYEPPRVEHFVFSAYESVELEFTKIK